MDKSVPDGEIIAVRLATSPSSLPFSIAWKGSHCVQAPPGFALLFLQAQVPGAPDAGPCGI